MRSSEKNRFQNAFTVYNVVLDSVVSDMFGKSATAITNYLTSTEPFDAQHCVSLLQRSLKKKAGAVVDSIEEYSITDEQKTRIAIIRKHHYFIDSLVGEIDACIVGSSNCLCCWAGLTPGNNESAGKMILTAIYSMLSTGEVWNPTDLYKFDMPEQFKERQIAMAVKQAARFLESQGLNVS